MRHKRRLEKTSNSFLAYPRVLFVFQTFNKAANVRQLVFPLCQKEARNILLFADGCIDRTASVAHRMMTGRNHYVIQSNDTYEISNYRLAMQVARFLDCTEVVLLQDDDIFTEGLFDWLDKALSFMAGDKSIAIVGGNGGANFIPSRCNRADAGLSSVPFEMWRKDGMRGFRLGHYQDMTLSSARATAGAFPREFVSTVNRAPQVISVEAALTCGFFPTILEPYQYDDDFNCLKAWSTGRKVLHMPTDSKRGNVGTGGMRLYNSVSTSSRPQHFCRNWNFILDTFGSFLNSGELEGLLAQANSSLKNP